MTEAHGKAMIPELEQISRGMNHEMRGSAGIIKQGIQYLESLPAIKEQKDQQQILGLMADAASHLESLLDGLTRLSRPMEINRSSVPLADILDRTLEGMNGELTAQSITVTKNLSPIAPSVMGDQALLEEAFRALFANAVQAMPSGGSLRVDLKVAGPGLECTITDTGCGIQKEKMERVFLPFFTTRPRPQNLGIGLAIAKAIVEAHEGTIELESRPKEETRVIVRLPVAKSMERAEIQGGSEQRRPQADQEEIS